MRNNNGFTLIELLIAMAISTYVIGAIFMTYQSQQTSYTEQEQIVTAQQTLRASTSVMAMEIRMAGFDPTGLSNAGISKISTTDTLIFTFADESSPPNYFQYEYIFDAANNTLDRNRFQISPPTGKQIPPAQTFADNIEAMGFAYAFDFDGNRYPDTYNAGGTEAIIWAVDTDGDNDLDANLDTDGNGVIDAADGPGEGGNGLIAGRALVDINGDAIPNVPVAAISAVRVWILARTSRPRRNFTNGATYTVGNRVITPDRDADAGNDDFPMRLSDSIIKCKNLGI